MPAISALAAETGRRIPLGGGSEGIQAWVEILPSGDNKMKAIPYVRIPDSPMEAGKAAEHGETLMKTLSDSLRERNAVAAPSGGSEDLSLSGISRLVGNLREAVRAKRRGSAGGPATNSGTMAAAPTHP